VSEVVANGWDVVASIAFSSDVEIASLELRVSCNKPIQEHLDGCSDLFLCGIIVEDARAFREPSAYWLVNVQQVADFIPCLSVCFQGHVIVD
jgi:hypothetical protein